MREHGRTGHNQRVSPKTCPMASASMGFQIKKDTGGGLLLPYGSQHKVIRTTAIQALQRTATPLPVLSVFNVSEELGITCP